MGRPRKPTKVLELHGAFKHNPNRRRPEEPQDDRPLGDPPKRIPDEVVAYWDEIVAMCGDVLAYRDRWAVEIAARLMAKLVLGMPSLLDAVDELHKAGALDDKALAKLINQQTITSSEISTLRGLLAAFGMTPADRTKLSAKIDESEKPANAFAQIAAEARSKESCA